MKLENLDNFDPSTCVNGKIMRLKRITGNIFRKYLKPHKITESQLNILFVLTHRGALNQKQLAQITRLEKSSLNRNLTRLFDMYYLTRNGFPKIKITEHGLKFVNQMIPEWRKAMDEVNQLLGEEGKSALNTLHSKLIK